MTNNIDKNSLKQYPVNPIIILFELSGSPFVKASLDCWTNWQIALPEQSLGGIPRICNSRSKRSNHWLLSLKAKRINKIVQLFHYLNNKKIVPLSKLPILETCSTDKNFNTDGNINAEANIAAPASPIAPKFRLAPWNFYIQNNKALQTLNIIM